VKECLLLEAMGRREGARLPWLTRLGEKKGRGDAAPMASIFNERERRKKGKENYDFFFSSICLKVGLAN
jgi:hypothetical protein